MLWLPEWPWRLRTAIDFVVQSGRRLPNKETTKRVAQIAAAVVAGLPPRVVGARFGVSVSSVYRCCRACGVLLRSSDVLGRLAAADARRCQMRQQVKRGVPIASVAIDYGVSEDTVRRACGRKRSSSGLTSGGRSARRGSRSQSATAREPAIPLDDRALRRAHIAAAVVAGLTTEQAAAKFGVSRGLVYYALSESGLELTKGPVAEALRRAVVQLAARGNPAETIARRLGLSEQRVRSLCEVRGVKLLTPRDRVEAARLLARRCSLSHGVNLTALLDGEHVKVLGALRDGEHSLAEIGKRLNLPTRRVFDIWAQALHRLAVPAGTPHEGFVKARRQVLSSGLSLNALCRGHHTKLVRAMRDSNLTMEELARNARTSPVTVWRLWYLALDRAAIAAARAATVSQQHRRKRRTKRERRLLRDLVL